MLETRIIFETKPKLKNPVCVVGLPGIGNIGRIAVGYMAHQLKAKKFAELYSPYFYPFVMVHNDLVHTLRNEFYFLKNKRGNDIIMLIGDCQTYDPKGHYEVVGKILDFLKSLGCKKIITIGGFSVGKIVEKPRVYGIANDAKFISELKNAGIETKVSGEVGTIVGASGILIGIGKLYNMAGYCLLGETGGYPIFTDPTAAEAVLVALQKLINMKIDLTKLEERVKAMHEFIKKIEETQRQAIEQMQKGKKPEELKYIG